jgi:hypothetical protein
MSWSHASTTKYLWKPVSLTGQTGTVSMWIKTAAFPGARYLGGMSYSADLVTPTGQLVSHLMLRTHSTVVGSNGQAGGRMHSATGQTNDVTESGTSLIGGQWNHICVVRDPSTTDLFLYVNGAQVATADTATRTWSTSLPNLLTIGQYYAGSAANALISASYAEVAVYNVALSSTVITTQLYTGTGAGKAANHADIGTAPLLYAPLTSTSQLALTVGTGSLTEAGGTETWSADHPTITAAAGSQSNAPRASLLRMLRSA